MKALQARVVPLQVGVMLVSWHVRNSVESKEREGSRRKLFQLSTLLETGVDKDRFRNPNAFVAPLTQMVEVEFIARQITPLGLFSSFRLLMRFEEWISHHYRKTFEGLTHD